MASWVGMSPGSYESAGKKSTRITHGDKFLKILLVQCAGTATRTKNPKIDRHLKQFEELVHKWKSNMLPEGRCLLEVEISMSSLLKETP